MNRDEIVNIIIAEVRETVPELENEAITDASSMVDLGVDSIERSEVILVAMEKVGIKVPMVELHGPRNIGELADLMLEKSAG